MKEFDLRRKLYRLSGYLQRLIVPGLRHSQERYRGSLQETITSGSDWLDIGCGHEIFPEWLRDSLGSERELVSRCRQAIGVDSGDMRPHRSLQLKYCASAETLPFADASFSVASANMVVEHLVDPEAALCEIYRVLRPGGLFIFHTPNVRTPLLRLVPLIPLRIKSSLVSTIDGRKEDDIFPTHYRLNDEDSIRSAAERSGFLVSKFEFVETSPILSALGPLVIFELIAILLSRCKTFAHLRPDLLVVFEKPTVVPPTMSAGEKRTA